MKDFLKLVFKFTIIIFVFVGIIGGGIFAYTKITGKDINIGNNLSAKERSKTVLIAGLHPDGPLTDFIMLAKYNAETGKINAISIPRDTKVVGTVDGKINSAYAKGRKIENLEEKVKDLTSIQADYYVLFDTAAVKKMVDAIGGIPMDVPINMKYDDNEQNLHIDLKKGYQVLDGDKAEQFIRFRKNNDNTGYPEGDVGRIAAQQIFIKAAIREVLKPSTLLKIPEIIKLGFECVKTDVKLSDVLGYVEDIKNFKMENLRLETLPGEGTYIGNISYFVHYSEKTKTLVDELFINDTIIDSNQAGTQNVSDIQPVAKATADKSKITIEVLNGTSKSGLANTVAEKLKIEGYNVTKIGNYKTTSSIKTTITNRTDNDYAKDIKSVLGKGTVKNEKEDSSKVDVTVILGNDY